MKPVEPPDFEKHRRQLYRANRAQIRDLLRGGGLEKKIENFCNLHGFSREEVAKSIRENDIVAAVFAKDPRKQSCDEKLAGGFIRRLDGIKNFAELPKGQKGLSVLRGEIREKRKIGGKGSGTKTIDFHWRYQGTQFYAAHKYTKDSGGAQDNQFKDLQAFIEEARDSVAPDVVFLVIADGAFYQRRAGGKDLTRLAEMQQRCTPSVHATTSRELSDLLAKITKKTSP